VTQGPVRLARSLDCPNCGGTVQVRAGANTLEVACSHCGALIDPTDDRARILDLADEHREIRPAIELGTRGELSGAQWEVVGMLVRSDSEDRWSWQEYLLFNPWRGFVWLVLSEGDWTFVEPARLPQRAPDKHVQVDGTEYRRTATGYARVDHVRGEFYWRVKAGDTVQTADYESFGSSTLYFEGTEDEINWSVGTRISAGRMKAAFAGLDESAVEGSGGASGESDDDDGSTKHYAASLMRNLTLLLMVLVYVTADYSTLFGIIGGALLFMLLYAIGTAIFGVVIGATANGDEDEPSAGYRAIRTIATVAMGAFCAVYFGLYSVLAVAPQSYDSSSSGYSSGRSYYGK